MTLDLSDSAKIRRRLGKDESLPSALQNKAVSRERELGMLTQTLAARDR
jgi:hypothetical protein